MIPDMYLILFMLIFNSVPGMVNAALDQILPIAQLEQKPELFKNSSQNKMFPRRVFWLTLVDSGEFKSCLFELNLIFSVAIGDTVFHTLLGVYNNWGDVSRHRARKWLIN